MNILIITGIFPPDIGGPATYVPSVATALAERGHIVTVVTLSDDPLSPPALSPRPPAPYSIVRLPRRAFKPWRWLRTLWTVLQLGRQADVLFVNGLALEAICANFLLRKPLVLKVVGDWAWERTSNEQGMRDGFEEFQSQPSNLKITLRKALRAWWTRQADRVIVPSRYLAQWVKKWGVPEERITVVYNAVESSGGIQPAYLPLAPSLNLKVVTVGRLVPWKRVDALVRAVAQLDDVGLVVIGDGPERERLEAVVQTVGVTDRVCFAGQRSKAETLALMAACDLFMLNSTYEGFPHVVLEAMDVGLPVIATAVGGTPEVVQDGENGRLIAPTDVNVLCNVLSPLVSSPTERQRLALGAKRTVERFRFPVMVQETEALLQQSAALQSAS